MVRRAINPKSRHLRCLAGDAGGVGIPIGDGVRVEAPELLPIDTGGALLSPLDHDTNDEPGWAITLGGDAGEDGVVPGADAGGLGMIDVGIYSPNGGKAHELRNEVVEELNADLVSQSGANVGSKLVRGNKNSGMENEKGRRGAKLRERGQRNSLGEASLSEARALRGLGSSYRQAERGGKVCLDA